MTFELCSRAGGSSFTNVVGAPRMGRLARATLFVSLAACALAPPALAQERGRTPAPAATENYQPTVGQEGKDVVWVPTPQVLVDKMLDMAHVTPQDRLVDLGSGDGRTVISAAKRGLHARGIEYDAQMAELARRNARQAGVSDRATFVTGDLFKTNFSDANVVTMFLLPSINEQLRPTLLNMKPGTRIVSNTFRMGDWQPDQSESVREGCDHYCTALLWIVPAKVEGRWRVGTQELRLKQKYQILTGTLGSASISDARMNGNQISFTVNGASYTGTVNGRAMRGTSSGSSAGAWSATRL